LRAFIATCALLAATGFAFADSTAQSSSAASAALLPPPQSALPYSWAGFYLRGSSDLASATVQATAVPVSSLSSAALASSSSANGSMSNGQFGANWQSGSTVVGFEGDMQWSDQWASPLTSCGLGCSLNDRVRVPWLATFRARAGTAFDRVYVYGTGGFATSGTADSMNPAAAAGPPNFVDLSTGNLDWTIGGGMEFALDRDVSAKIEYLHNTPTGASVSLFDNVATDSNKNNIVRGGLNYRLPIGQ
jgi:outer membrane immunogenic protein